MKPGQVIRKARRCAKLRQVQVASALGVSQPLVSLIETGRIRLTYQREREILSVIESLASFVGRVRATVGPALPSLREIGRQVVERARRERARESS